MSIKYYFILQFLLYFTKTFSQTTTMSRHQPPPLQHFNKGQSNQSPESYHHYSSSSSVNHAYDINNLHNHHQYNTPSISTITLPSLNHGGQMDVVSTCSTFTPSLNPRDSNFFWQQQQKQQQQQQEQQEKEQKEKEQKEKEQKEKEQKKQQEKEQQEKELAIKNLLSFNTPKQGIKYLSKQIKENKGTDINQSLLVSLNVITNHIKKIQLICIPQNRIKTFVSVFL